jgi:hypothetical protein
MLKPALTPFDRNVRRLILLACLALLGALALAAPADAGVGKYRVGITTGPPVGSGDFDRMRQVRARHARITFSWDAIETNPPNGSNGCAGAQYTDESFQLYDLQVLFASRKGIRVMPMIFDSPSYAAKQGSRMPSTRSKRAINGYKCFLNKLVKRYGHGGALVRAKKVAKPVEDWQLWNEENLPIYAANGNPNPREYARFVKISSKEINRVDRKANIVLGGLPEVTKRGISSKRFLTRFYRVNGIKRKFDVVALHPFAKNARGVKGALQRLRDLLRRVGDRRQVIWLTEVGYATDGPKGYFLVSSEKVQAKKTRSTLAFLKKNHRRYKVGTVDWFRWRDLSKYGQTNHWWEYAGIYRKNGSPKPACNKYRRFTGGRGKCKKIIDEQQSQSILELPDIGVQSARAGVIPSPPPE